MMPPKRTWSQSNEELSPQRQKPSEPSVPSISRKVKACAACRKQKIKCIFDHRGPPCRRCTERQLPCVLNKSLQTLIDERGQWRNAWSNDLEHVHAALQEVLSQLSLPSLPPLQSKGAIQSEESPQESATRDDPGPSCDNSPRPSPGDDALLQVPIESLYQITRLRALRSDDAPDPSPLSPAPINDFISQGLINIEDAERLTTFYLHRIDTFMYLIGSGNYRDLESMRRGSAVLTAAVCTVAALHDPASNHLYGICNREFRRLMAASMFDRRINKDCLRAMCIGAYWLHDTSWFLSGCAIRRATEVNLSNSYRVITRSDNLNGENTQDAMECLRIWYILYICDHHLSILYGRQSTIREDASILAWEEVSKSSATTDSDRRMFSQMSLLIIMSDIRDLFGPDIEEPVPRAFASQLTSFSRRIDQWMAHWTTELGKLHQSIGEFPTKGALLHHHFAKLHLHSHVFRGLKGAPVPPYFQESAAASVAASTAVIEMLLADPDVRQGLVGIPHYIHSMIAFACVFLLKVAAQYVGQYIEDTIVLDLTAKVVQQLRETPVGKYHLVHLMADGLEKMAASKIKSPSATFPRSPASSRTMHTGMQMPNGTTLQRVNNGEGTALYANDMIGPSFEENFNLGLSQFLHLDSGNYDFNLDGLI